MSNFYERWTEDLDDIKCGCEIDEVCRECYSLKAIIDPGFIVSIPDDVLEHIMQQNKEK